MKILRLSERERDALEMLIADGCAIEGPVRMDLRPTLLGIRERLLTDKQKRERAAREQAAMFRRRTTSRLADPSVW
jgi:hypothetical protein